MSVQEYLNKLSDTDVISACINYETWKKSGKLPDGELKSFIEWGGCTYNGRDLEKYMLEEALRRFKEVVPILLKNFPSEFIK